MLKLKDVLGVIDYAAIEYHDGKKYMDFNGNVKLLADLPEHLLDREVERIDDSGLDEIHLIITLK